MQKSVLMPIEKYERLIGKNKETKDASTETEVSQDPVKTWERILN